MATNVEQNKKALSSNLDNTDQTLDGLEEAMGEAVGDVDGMPEGWIQATIGDVLAAQSDGKLIHQGWSPQCHTEKAPSGKWGVLKTTAIQDGFYLEEANKLLPSDKEPKTRIEVKEGDLLMTNAGPRSRCGVTTLVRKTRGKLMLSGKMYRMRFNFDLIHSGYIEACLRSEAVCREIDQRKTGISESGLNLTQQRFLTVPLILSPYEEQKIIVHTLDALLAQVDSIKTHLDTIPKILKTFRQSILASAVSGKLTEEWRGVNECGDWKEVKLSDVGKGFNYGTSSKSEKEGDVPVLRMGNLQDGRLDWEKLVFTSDKDEIKKYLLEKGDVLFNRTNSPELVGKTSIFRGEQKSIYAGYLIRVKGSDLLNTEFLNILLNSPDARNYCREVKTDGVSQSNINAQKLRAFKFELPEMKEQTQIVRRVEELFAFSDQIEQQVKNAQGRVNNLTQSILAKAFRGELTTQWRADNPELISGDNSAQALLAAIKKEREALEPVKKSSVKKAVKKTIKKKEAVAVKKPKAVVEAVSVIARQNKQEKPSKGLDNAATAVSIEIPETDIQWSAFIRSHYKKSNPDLTLDELIAHLVQALSIKRLSPQRKAVLEQVIKKACKWQVLYKESGEYCLYESQFSDYDNEALDILLPKLLRKGSSASQDDLYRDFLQALGFKRSSPKAEQRFKSYLRSALIRKVLQRDGDQLKRI